MATVGKPHRWLDPRESGSVANRIVRLLEWEPERLVAVFPVRTNLWETPKRKWPAVAKARIGALRSVVADHDGVVVIGRRAATEFGLGEWPPMTWKGGWIRPVAMLPYPSGPCYFWQESANVARAKEFFERCAKQLLS